MPSPFRLELARSASYVVFFGPVAFKSRATLFFHRKLRYHPIPKLELPQNSPPFYAGSEILKAPTNEETGKPLTTMEANQANDPTAFIHPAS